jgi:cell division protein FtsZ
MEPEHDFMAKPVAKPRSCYPAELNITMKQVDTATQQLTSKISPMEMTIEESLRMRADERRKN